MTQRLTLTVIALTGFGFIGVSQSGYCETRLLTLGSESSLAGDSTGLAKRVPPDGNDLVAAQAPGATNLLALTTGSNGDPGTVNQVNQTDPGNAALEASRVAEPPQSRLRSFFSAFIEFGAAASSANR
jgi:hypothetical protein